MRIRNALLKDIENVSILEKKIEKEENAATKETLLSRFKMFPQGFYVAEENDKILGYVESCLWDKDNFNTFEEIKDFPKHHNSNGRYLYAIFLGVDRDHRRKGIGSKLIKRLQKYASEKQLDKFQLVAGEGFLINFYEKLGFEVIRELPNFMSDSKGTLMEYNIK